MDLFGYFNWLTIQRSTSKLSIKSFSVVSHSIAPAVPLVKLHLLNFLTLEFSFSNTWSKSFAVGFVLCFSSTFWHWRYGTNYTRMEAWDSLACRHWWWWWWAHHSVPGYGDIAGHSVRGGCVSVSFKIWGLWLFKMENLISVKHRKCLQACHPFIGNW